MTHSFCKLLSAHWAKCLVFVRLEKMRPFFMKSPVNAEGLNGPFLGVRNRSSVFGDGSCNGPGHYVVSSKVIMCEIGEKIEAPSSM